jgi:hypothetical protein
MTSKIKAGPPPVLPSVVLELLTYLGMSPFLPPNLAKRIKSHPTGSQYCGAREGKDRQGKSISANKCLVIYIFMNFPRAL